MKNPIEFFKMFKAMKKPQEAIIEMASSNSNPILKNAVEMAKNGNNEELMKLAQNLCKEKGINFDKEFKEFMNNFK